LVPPGNAFYSLRAAPYGRRQSEAGHRALRSILRRNDEAGKRKPAGAGPIYFLELSTFAFALQEIKTVKALALRAMSAVFNSTPLSAT
jgi:hypothetical protein